MVSAQIAASLEVSGWPKPGNVHRTADFPDTTFEEFIAGAVSLGPPVRLAAERGVKVGRRKSAIDQVGVGGLILQAVRNVNSWHKGGNTHLGISLLFIPLASAAGLTFIENGFLDIKTLRSNVIRVFKSTTASDALETYEAINEASSAALGKVQSLEVPDLTDPKWKEKILGERYTLFELMEISSEWDNISREWVTGMEISFDTGLKEFSKVYGETGNVNVATVHTYLRILCTYPDTFIARKVGVKFTDDISEAVKIGLKTSLEISRRAKEILEKDGLMSSEGKKLIEKLDFDLRKRNLNPGTTADLTANSIFLAVLNGFRP